MNVTSRLQDDVLIIAIEGKILGGADTAPLLEAVQNAVGSSIRKVVLDLHAVPWMSSMGLGALISARAKLRAMGGELRLARPDEAMNAMLVMNNLTMIFGIHSTVEDAISSFR